MSDDPNNRQIGGDHYQTGSQHWDLIARNNIPYLEGCATKYVTRWRKKDGRKDLEKALHYIDKAISLVVEGCYKASQSDYVDDHIINTYIALNKLNPVEDEVIRLLINWEHLDELESARAIVYLMLQKDNTGQEHPFGYTHEEE